MTGRQQWRAGLGAAGLALGLAGIALEWRPLVWAAVVVLGVAVVMRLAEWRRVTSTTQEHRATADG